MNTINEMHPVNWADGMKLNKEIFIAQDNANISRTYNLMSLEMSSVRYGIIPVENNYKINISVDNQNVISVHVINCKAITQGGVMVNVTTDKDNKEPIIVRKPITDIGTNTVYWAMLIANPFDRNPFGEVDTDETPLRLPYVKPGVTVELVEDHRLNQYLSHPLALPIGKIYVNGGSVKNDEDYLPPCISVNALEDLLGLHAELDSFLSSLEQSCSHIVQKIFKKKQQNDLSELVQFLCDRIMIQLAQSISYFRMRILHESPVAVFSEITSLARLIKNTIDLRIGSGRDELMNYLCEWCDLNQGELVELLTKVSIMRYKHHDINENITVAAQFAKVIGKLFNTLSNLEFIGKKKDSGLFVKEEKDYATAANNDAQQKSKRKFFG